MSTLEGEYFAAVGQVRQPHLDRIRALGVAPATIAELGERYPAFGIVSAAPERAGTYQPQEDGTAHVVQPVFDGGLVDLVAWRSSQPQRWWTRRGLGWMLNADRCLASRWDAGFLTLHATPLDWLRSGGEGGVILDWDAPDVVMLRAFATIACPDRSFMADLRNALVRSFRMPKLVGSEVRHAA
ncbi:hypothetical protein [Sphingomonas turrisvirgatae]|uniref:Uncharacterized protein n=1 Tax=Sphingomonas turrisvirgatae TaxID=1888892 RepID=A0A1E3LUH0_9SPHN|nr:hypothetical protein [Sphingomonas turrisvirgatae]ODP37383.1 hypothetical protein BFL28_18070 [Sphingomonas turrisvirgatae]